MIPGPTYGTSPRGRGAGAGSDFLYDDAVQYLPSLTLTRPISRRNVNQPLDMLTPLCSSIRWRRLLFIQGNQPAQPLCVSSVTGIQRRFSSQTASVDAGCKKLA